MEAVQACLAGIDRNVPVSVEPAAAALLLPHTVYKVADLLALTEWPASQLRLVIEHWQPDIEVRIRQSIRPPPTNGDYHDQTKHRFRAWPLGRNVTNCPSW
jgi:hypothetical protein